MILKCDMCEHECEFIEGSEFTCPLKQIKIMKIESSKISLHERS
jgi:hypothetical protein